MSKLFNMLFLMFLIFKSAYTSTLDYEVKHTLPENDQFFEIEKEILSKGRINIEEAIRLISEMEEDKNLTSQKVYKCLRTSYQFISDKFYFDISNGNGEIKGDKFKEIQILNKKIENCLSLAKEKFSNCAQILELLGDFAYFNTSRNDGKNVALLLHFKAYCLGQATDSIKLKITLDLDCMYDLKTMGKSVNSLSARKSYLFSLTKNVPDDQDIEKWHALSIYFYNLANKKDVLKNDKFFNYWVSQNKNYKVKDEIVKSALIDLFEQMVSNELEFNRASKVLLEKVERQKQELADRENVQIKLKERQEEFKVALAGLEEFQKLPNPVGKIETILDKLNKFNKELKEYTELPNFKELRSLFPDTEEAEILNGFFMYMQKEYKKTLTMIEALKSKDTDPRLCFLKFICLKRTNAPMDAVEKCVNLWLQLEPENNRARHIKLDMDIEKEKKNK